MTYVFSVSNDEGIFQQWAVMGAVQDLVARECSTNLAVEVVAASEAVARSHLEALLGYAFEVSNDEGQMLRHHVDGATAEPETHSTQDHPRG
jgi:hypothetical protein